MCCARQGRNTHLQQLLQQWQQQPSQVSVVLLALHQGQVGVPGRLCCIHHQPGAAASSNRQLHALQDVLQCGRHGKCVHMDRCTQVWARRQCKSARVGVLCMQQPVEVACAFVLPPQAASTTRQQALPARRGNNSHQPPGAAGLQQHPTTPEKTCHPSCGQSQQCCVASSHCHCSPRQQGPELCRWCCCWCCCCWFADSCAVQARTQQAAPHRHLPWTGRPWRHPHQPGQHAPARGQRSH